MNPDVPQKVTASHLQRTAYLYVRQSTVRQVFENNESTQRQYALRQRAVALGWPPERIVVIDTDQGLSGASAADRAGFQRLVTEVGMGRAGIVLGLEVSRLARNSADWHRLLEICALTETLILDEDGIYDPAHFNDRLLLGLKGTMSEAELHVLHARLRGGLLNKARRGELDARSRSDSSMTPSARWCSTPTRRSSRACASYSRPFAARVSLGDGQELSGAGAGLPPPAARRGAARGVALGPARTVASAAGAALPALRRRLRLRPEPDPQGGGRAPQL